MIAASVMIQNPSGLHARLATQFCALARQFQSEVTVRASDRFISARQILDLMAANARQGQTIVIHCDGPDETAAISQLMRFIETLRE